MKRTQHFEAHLVTQLSVISQILLFCDELGTTYVGQHVLEYDKRQGQIFLGYFKQICLEEIFFTGFFYKWNDKALDIPDVIG